MEITVANGEGDSVRQEDIPRAEHEGMEGRAGHAEVRRMRSRGLLPGRDGGGEEASEENWRPTVLEGTTPRGCKDGPRNMEAGRDRAAGESARKGKDKHASIRISLEQHAERVAKKQRTGGDTGTDRRTAAQRLADIRSRVLAKCAAGVVDECGKIEAGGIQATTVERLGMDSGCMMEH